MNRDSTGCPHQDLQGPSPGPGPLPPRPPAPPPPGHSHWLPVLCSTFLGTSLRWMCLFSALQQPLSLLSQLFSLLLLSLLSIPAPPFLALFPAPTSARSPPFCLFFSPGLRSSCLILSLAPVHLCSCVPSDPCYAGPRPWVRGPCVRASLAPQPPASRSPPPPAGTALPYCRGAVHCAGTVNRWTPSWRDKTAAAAVASPSD